MIYNGITRNIIQDLKTAIRDLAHIQENREYMETIYELEKIIEKVKEIEESKLENLEI